MMHTIGSRRGAAYLLVLVTVLVTIAAGTASVMVHRARRAQLMTHADVEMARLAAQSALELAVSYMQVDGKWRVSRGDGVWSDEVPLLGALVSVEVFDADGDIDDDWSDPVTIVAEATYGTARQSVSVTLTPIPEPYDSLAYGSSNAGTVYFNGSMSSDQGVASNGAMHALFANVFAVARSGAGITGGTYRRATEPNSGVQQHPDVSEVLSWYIENGTVINRALIPSNRMEGVLLSPSSNPYGGSLNPRGIYIIDCNGTNFQIRNSRVVGTLVLLNTGSGTRITDSVSWAPAEADLPIVLAQGPLRVDLVSTNLSESTLNVNFNPVGTPFNGIADDDRVDVYTSKLMGLVYATGNVVATGNTRIEGQLIAGGNVTFQGAVAITYDKRYSDTPPPGFIGRYRMLMQPDTFARVVDE